MAVAARKMPLTEVSALFNRVVDEQLVTPTLSAPALAHVASVGKTKVLGFDVPDPVAEAEARERALAERRKTMSTYQADRDEQINLLAKHNIIPLGTMQAERGEELFASSELITGLRPDGLGNVCYSSALKKEAQAAGGRRFLRLFLLEPVIVASVFTASVFWFWETSWWFTAVVFAVATLACCLVKYLACWDTDSAQMQTRQRYAERFIKTWAKDRTRLMKLLWPDNRAPSHGPSIRIVLPTPPDDVVGLLLKAKRAKLDLVLAAHPDTIGFASDPGEQIIDGVSGEWAEELRVVQERERMLADPIIYHVHKSSLAVLAQFGENPIEEAVVQRIMHSDMIL